jgi:hypothetical protein
VRVYRDDDEIRQLLGCANALQYFTLVDRVHRVSKAAMVGRLVSHTEQLDLIRRLLVGHADGAGGLLVADSSKHPQFLRGHQRVSDRPQRVDAGTAGRLACGRRRARERREGRGNRNEGDAAFVGVEIARRSGSSAVLAHSRVYNAGFVEHPARLAHAFQPPVGCMVVRPRHEIEPDCFQVLGHLRRTDNPDASEFRLGHGRRSRQVEGCALEVAERDIRVVYQLADRCEPAGLGHWSSDDAVADRGKRKAVRDARCHLAVRIADRRLRRRLLGKDDGAGEDHPGEAGEQTAWHVRDLLRQEHASYLSVQSPPLVSAIDRCAVHGTLLAGPREACMIRPMLHGATFDQQVAG